MWFIEPSKTNFSPAGFGNPVLANKIKLIINKIMLDFWSEICRTEIFENIYGWKICGRLVFLKF